MSEELVDIVNENNELTGEQRPKSEAHRLGLWHRAVHVWLYNQKNEILLQLRAKEKKIFPDVWDVAVAGHISAGEDPITTVLRETEEEIGLTIDPKQLSFFKIFKTHIIYKAINNNEFLYTYFLPFNGKLADLKLQKEEVQDINFFPLQQLIQGAAKTPDKFAGKFINDGSYWTEVFDKLKKISST